MACCNGLKIALETTPEGTRSWMLDDGVFYFDIDNQTGVQLAKGLQEVTDRNKIKTQAAVGISLPDTPKNRFALQFGHDPNSQPGRNLYPVAIMQGASTLNFDILEVKNVQGGRLSCEMQQRSDHWYKLADATFLKDLQFLKDENWVMDYDEILSSWDNIPYDDTNNYLCIPPVDYSGGNETGWSKKGALMVEDLRPLMSPLWLLQKGFCELGWKFRSPFYESDHGRCQFAYLLSPEYGNDEATRKQREFSVEGGTAQFIGGEWTYQYDPVRFPDVIYDPGDNWQDDVYFIGKGIFNFRLDGLITIIPKSEPGSSTEYEDMGMRISLIKGDGTNDELEFVFEELIKKGYEWPVTGFPISVFWENVTLLPGQYLYVQIDLINEDDIFSGQFTGGLTNDVIRSIFQEGDTVNLSTAIRQDMTLLELFMGCAFNPDARIHTDWIKNELWLFPPETVNIYDNEEIDGYYIEEAVTLSDIICDSMGVVNNESDLERWFQVQFKKSTDQYIKDNALEQEFPLFSKRIDRGEQFKEGVQKVENPIFEPTANGPTGHFAIAGTNLRYVDLPKMWDSSSFSSYDIAPRILYVHPSKVGQYHISDLTTIQANLYFKDDIVTSWPYAFHVPNLPINGAGDFPTHRLVFGSTEENIKDYYFFFWRHRALSRDIRSMSFQFDYNLSQYNSLDYRRWNIIPYNGRGYMGRIASDNFTLCDQLCEVTFFPSTNFAVCAEEIDFISCDNAPEIKLETSADKNCVRATGNNSGITSPIAGEIWVYSIDNGNTWLPYVEGDWICGEEFVRFIRQVSYSDGCPDTSARATWSKLQICNNPGEISIDVEEEANRVRAFGVRDNINSPILNETWTVSINGQPPIPYIEGDWIAGFNTVTFYWVVEFADACDDLEGERTVTTTRFTPCDNYGYYLHFVEIGVDTCHYYIEIGGSGNSEIFTKIIEYRYEDQDWVRYHDGIHVRGYEGLEARAWVYFCDGCKELCLTASCPGGGGPVV
jgi:hypothetical protein